MNLKNFIIGFILLSIAVGADAQCASEFDYLDNVKAELVKQWPKNRTVNIVFHGHSVPSGFAKTPDVRTLDAYPYQTLKLLKTYYPYAVINTITTAIGGETSESGAARFESQVLCHRPDVLFIDYALNDRSMGLERAEKAWRSMIEKALKQGIKVILCTPTPDQSADILSMDDPLNQHADMIRHLADEYHVGLADFYAEFHRLIVSGAVLKDYMSQVNHPNALGHLVALSIISPWFF